MSIADIPAAWKFGTGGLIAIMSVLAYLSTFQTDAEAQQYQQQHGEQLALFRVQQIEAQIAQYRYQLLSANLSPQQREWITTEIKRLTDLIACIRAGRC